MNNSWHRCIFNWHSIISPTLLFTVIVSTPWNPVQSYCYPCMSERIIECRRSLCDLEIVYTSKWVYKSINKIFSREGELHALNSLFFCFFRFVDEMATTNREFRLFWAGYIFTTTSFVLPARFVRSSIVLCPPPYQLHLASVYGSMPCAKQIS